MKTELTPADTLETIAEKWGLSERSLQGINEIIENGGYDEAVHEKLLLFLKPEDADRLMHWMGAEGYENGRPPKTHYLKTYTEYFQKIVSGEKTFDLRKNDRDFRTGDTLAFLETYNLDGKPTATPTGVMTERVVTYVLENVPHFGLADGYCITGLESKRTELETFTTHLGQHLKSQILLIEKKLEDNFQYGEDSGRLEAYKNILKRLQ